jgi:galactokinase
MSHFFSADQPIVTAHAPGRLDVMGGISDYSGSLLLQMPIKQFTTVELQRNETDFIKIRSVITKSKTDNFNIPASELLNKSYEQARQLLSDMPGGDWAAYVIGCIMTLYREKNIRPEGLSISIHSTVPLGKGVSSSAALEVATMCALAKLYNIEFGDMELPLLAQKAENLVVGAPCGLMDQVSSYLGQKNKLLPIICQPHAVLPALTIPAGISFVAIDSGIRHAVSGASYSDVRAAAFMAYTIVALKSGCDLPTLAQAKTSGNREHLPYSGYLANIPLSVFQQSCQNELPESITGAAFLEKYHLSIDPVTTVHPDRNYHLRNCAAHPIQENNRIRIFTNILQHFTKQKNKEDAATLLGELMFQSHAGYSSVGLGNSYTDELVQRVRDAGKTNGVYGARITGGGSGGTVCILCYGEKGKKTARQIFEDYRSEHKMKNVFLFGSSDGAFRLSNQRIGL